ncbi:MAG: ATP-binding protein [Pelolinea sp.]|nr:ATP-binding protein [Pelolinea sp.]
MITMAFPGRFSSLNAIRKFFARAAEQAGLDQKSIADVELAVDEAASNIIDHAYGGEGKGEIECSYRVIPEGLEVILRDHGKPFDPEAVAQPDLTSDVCCREPGGLGLHFMKSLMDSVEFSFNGYGGNLLTMTKLQKKAVKP